MEKQEYLPIRNAGDSTSIDDTDGYDSQTLLEQDTQETQHRRVNNRLFEIITGIVLVLILFLLAGLLVVFNTRKAPSDQQCARQLSTIGTYNHYKILLLKSLCR